LRVGGVLGILTRIQGGQQGAASVITECTNKGKVRVEASESIKAYCLDVGGVVGEAGTPDNRVTVTSVMKDSNGNNYTMDAGSVVKCKNIKDIYVGTKTLNAWLYAGGVAGSGSFSEKEELSHKGSDFIDCSTEEEILVEINNMPDIGNFSQWETRPKYTVFLGGMSGTLAFGYDSGDNKSVIAWNEKDTENPAVASPITLKQYDGSNTEYETGVAIGGVTGCVMGCYTSISKAVVSEKAKIKVSSPSQISTDKLLAIGGVAGSVEVPYNSGKNYVSDMDVKNSIVVNSKIWSAKDNVFIGGVTGTMVYGEIDKAFCSCEIKVSSNQITNSKEMYLAGIVGKDGRDDAEYMYNIVTNSTYKGFLTVVPDKWVQNSDVYMGGISGRMITQSGHVRSTNNVRDGAIITAKIGHVSDGNEFFVGGVAGACKYGETTIGSTGVDASINLYRADNAKIDMDSGSGVYAGGAVGSAGENTNYGNFALNSSYVTCNFRNAFSISANSLSGNYLDDNGVYVGGLAGEKMGGSIQMKKAYVSVRFNDGSGHDAWGTNEGIILSTDSGSPLNSVTFENAFAVQRASYAFTESVSVNGFIYDGYQMAPYFYQYTGAKPDTQGSSMYAKFYTGDAGGEEDGTIEIADYNFKYNGYNTFPVQGCVVTSLGNDVDFTDMAYDFLTVDSSGWSKKESYIYPVLSVNGNTEATGHMKRETVWPMYIGTSGRQASKTLDIISNLFH
ncbi:MAG: hypothetical protein K6E33_07280, partial [Lachnospiraceae bacterium]|nr:hypothetical protein [Lachnospiraceae bacterium]